MTLVLHPLRLPDRGGLILGILAVLPAVLGADRGDTGPAVTDQFPASFGFTGGRIEVLRIALYGAKQFNLPA